MRIKLELTFDDEKSLEKLITKFHNKKILGQTLELVCAGTTKHQDGKQMQHVTFESINNEFDH